MSQWARMRGRPWAWGWSMAALLVLTSAMCPDRAQAADDGQSAIASERAAHSLLIDAAQAGKRLVVVGDRGHILYSDDQGGAWTQAQVPSRQLLTAVYFVDAEHGWAVGHDAQVLASDDGGATWRKQFEDLAREAPLLDVLFLDTRHGFAVGAYGALLETRDGGQQWHDVGDRLDNPEQLHLNAIAQVKDRGLFIVGEQGSLYRSSDDGQSWASVPGPYEGSLFGVLGTASPATLLAFGLRGNLLRSTDFGDTWQRITLSTERGPFAAGLSGAALLDDGRVVVVGNAGSVLLSDDDGETFTVNSRRDRIALAGVAGLADQRLLLVGQGGIHLADAKGQDLEVQP
ncbi:WD40/YVTN/BNR-like repeat-containing protein [Pseudomonas cremoricolorata]|uniref:BNR/Asp-box repeat-containing protein n=1 Tax=Pseudomonas cremoricolorata TaxID=157783 RepID=A0A089WW95_9PSED|nr:YCF48-related protein [Pseudomonas cremoricolorata]AIR91514.1 BNR/Asp-box repeat-containing protein [Pseudomonas cremoricolorata]